MFMFLYPIAPINLSPILVFETHAANSYIAYFSHASFSYVLLGWLYWIRDFRLPTPDFLLPTSEIRSRTSDIRFRIPGSGIPTTAILIAVIIKVDEEESCNLSSIRFSREIDSCLSVYCVNILERDIHCGYYASLHIIIHERSCTTEFTVSTRK